MLSRRKQPIVVRRDETIAWNPYSWEAMAYGLVCSANLLYHAYAPRREKALDTNSVKTVSPRLYREMSLNVILMLYGLAIENLIKGLIIAEGIVKPFPTVKNAKGMYFDSGDEVDYSILADVSRRLNRSLLTHDLNRLFKKANVPRSREDTQLLELLEDAIKSGKYPIARDARIRQGAFPYLEGRTLGEIRQHVMALAKTVDNKLCTNKRHKSAKDNPVDLESLCLDS